MIARETLRTLSRDYLTRAAKHAARSRAGRSFRASHSSRAKGCRSALRSGHQLTKSSDLSQPGQFACKEQLSIVGPKGRIERVRVLGPARKYTQVEIAMTEQFKLGMQPPIRESGDIEGSPGCTLEGPAGSVALDKGVICALRHIHMTPADALRYGLKDKCECACAFPAIASCSSAMCASGLIRVSPSRCTSTLMKPTPPISERRAGFHRRNPTRRLTTRTPKIRPSE